jgi:pimeloyl-ACP methyl ester carboxylesterase
VRRLLLALLALQLAGCASVGRSLYEGDRDGRRDDAGFVQRSATVDGHKVEVLERPGDDEVVLLVHGFGGDQDSWNRIAPSLPKGYRLIAPSLPGFGMSSYKPEVRYDFATQADRLALLLDELGIGRVHVVGISMGGAVATTFAARHPDRARSLTAICPAGIDPPAPTDFQRSWKKGHNELIVREPKDYDHYLDLLFYGDPPAIPGPVRAYLVEEEIAAADRLTKIDTDLREVPGWLEGVIPNVVAPTLVIWGKEDEVLSYTGSTRFEGLEGVNIELLEDCGHACSFVRPDEVAAMIAAHLVRN